MRIMSEVDYEEGLVLSLAFVQIISVGMDESMKAFRAVNDKFLPGSVCSCGA